MKVLVTGGAGYIGSELVEKLALDDRIKSIIVYDNLSKDNYNLFLGQPLAHGGKVIFEQGELLDSRRLKKVLEGVNIVYHLAAKVTTTFANRDPHFFEQVNNWGTAELAYAIEESEVEKFIFTSSTSVYGFSKKVADEDKEVNPRTFYGISKMRGEGHAKRLLSKLNTYIIRSANVYGYGKNLRFDAVINRFMFDANFSNRITINGTGKQARPFIHIDVISNLLKDLAFTDVPSGIYNAVDRNLQVMEIVDVLKEIYPTLEFIFINQHLDLQELKVKTDSRLRQYLDFTNPNDLKKELLEFKAKFAF